MKDTERIIDENWDLLRAAVVLQACQDYAETLKHPGKKIRVKCVQKKWVTDDEKSLQRWFHSKLFNRLWCDSVKGEAILEQMRENHKNGRRFYSPLTIGRDADGRVCD